MRIALLLLALAAPATAQQADAGVPQDLEKELEKAIQADTSAAAQQGQKGPPAPAPAVTSSTGGAPQTLFRGAQSLNPDMSAILDADFGWQRRAPQLLSGDDTDLHAEGTRHAVGFTAQEVELAFSAIVDPYLKGEVYLTIPNLEGIEVEDGQHLHVQDFTRRPLINAAFLGADGMRGPGVQLSWLAPLPFFLTLYGEAFSLGGDAADQTGALPQPVASFGADRSTRPTLAAEAKAFFPLGESWSVYSGLNFASGKSPGVSLGDAGTTGVGREAQLYGADVYLKWKPINVAQGYESIAFQAEAIVRHFGSGDGLEDEWDGGAYAQIVAQFARRWFVGVRGDVVGVPSSSVLARAERVGLSLTFQGSEFSRVRGYLEAEHATAPSSAFLPQAMPQWAPAAYLQLEFSIGAHGAHSY
ncbi:MAG: hypothetical protein E6J67_04685 [Deltaproteobacteria bacterium]|nr:MAG: hypothetical protein E6J67_04685 [Deltaproteobacteria bacterium]